ncbi:MAG TPA: hypothetical protein VGR07_18710 [Thermoanaerobaculia bacterium]|nr:hypothetical protein [Thermoanaerobaculia bacterium]
MNTTTPTTPVPPKTPKNPARGNQQGQTTLAAKIDRWEAMSNNLLPILEEIPQLKPFHTELLQTITDAKVLRDHLRATKADVQGSTVRRHELIATGEGLFSHLSLGLRFVFGADSERLAAFSVKPRRRTGRTGKPSAPVATNPEAPTAPVADPQAAHGAPRASESEAK